MSKIVCRLRYLVLLGDVEPDLNLHGTRMRTFLRVFWMAAVVCALAAAAQAGAREDYQRGLSSFKALLANEKRAALRDEWLGTAAFFEKSLGGDARGESAPKCMYFLGRCHEELGKRSFLKADRQNALAAFDRMLKAFPRHSWADDSLYRKGLIMLEQAGDTDAARKIFQDVIDHYPKGDMAPEARKHLETLGGKSGKKDTVQAGKKASAKSARSGGTPARLNGIRHWSGQEYTRVVLDLDREVAYERTLEEQGGNKELRISLPGTTVAADVMRARNVGDGTLAQIRVGEGGGRTLVTVDLLRAGNYRVFALPDPYRVVIDVYADSGAGESGPDAAGTDHVRDTLEELQREQKSAPAREETAAKGSQKGGKRGGAAHARASKSGQPALVPSAKQKKYSGSLMEQLGLKVRTVMIDAGHGGKDPGAIANGVREKDVNLRMARIMGNMLQAQGFKVLYTRTTDKFIPLEERTALANAKGADLFISIHCNAYKDPRIHGLEVYYLNLATDAQAVRVAARENGVSAKKISDMQFILSDLMLNSKINESRQMAALVEKEVMRGVGPRYKISSHGSKGAFFYVLTGARMPSVLVELGYLTNPKEAAHLDSDEYLTAMARGLVNGIMAYKKKLERYSG